MKPAPFTYHRAHTVAEGVSLLNELGENAKVLAGGQSLIPMMNFRLARPEHLVDITHIPMLSEIEYSGEDMRIGSLVTHRAIETFDAKMPGSNIALLRAAMKFVGHYPIRTRGTIGGSIAHADATAEWCILAILLEAEISVVGTRGRRIIPAADMFYGLYTTALAPDEIITHVSFPRHPGAGVIVEHAERQGDFALAAVAAVVEYHDGIVTSGRVVVAGGGRRSRRPPNFRGGSAPEPGRNRERVTRK
jgi:carbon-monoxide dehydrogenase medium subunit